MMEVRVLIVTLKKLNHDVNGCVCKENVTLSNSLHYIDYLYCNANIKSLMLSNGLEEFKVVDVEHVSATI